MMAAAAPPLLPSYSFYECHESAALRARPEDIIEAVAGLDMRADKVTNTLLCLRELPAGLKRFFRRSAGPKPAEFGFETFTPLSRSAHELVLGLAGRFWRPDFGLMPLQSAEEFIRFNDPGSAKLVLRFQVIPHKAGEQILRTETFVYCPSWRTKALFTPYWGVIRLASGWIRRRTLKMVEKTLSLAA